ncbi:transcriptional regulator, MarR family [Paenibacillus curdlanolyticus YK9]|uniref:Transcriptional regulator, MarR family n=1 Tax=Paenibacillus curdlanolyticus YK9 TaxID=717606 RepID=E0IES3_9BACL|nr:MarR family winged helix-turn-helix transcriptional regulator [Paenibacillus curdlanolyticus]EFM09161.1 transcriptional regulator, MarR family [Paenibacillus curdlanolyticus YK9]
MSEHKQTTSELIRAFRQLRNMNWTGFKPSGGYTKSEIMTLFHVRHITQRSDHGLKSSDLARSLNVTLPTVTQTVNVLEARGLIERHRDPSDRRAVLLRLTAAGEQMTQDAEATMLRTIGGVVEHLGLERSQQLIGLLDDIFQFYADNGAASCTPENHEPPAPKR